MTTAHVAFGEAASSATAQLDRLLAVKGKRSIRDFHRETGRIDITAFET